MDIRPLILLLLALLLFVYLLATSTLCFYKTALFDPSADEKWSPPANSYQSLRIAVGHKENAGVQKIGAWYFPARPGAATILFLHGRNQNRTYRKYAVDLCSAVGAGLLLIDYRGFGDSSKTRLSLKSISEDACAALQWLLTRVPSDQIVIWGESLGGAAAISAASAHRELQFRAVVLYGTFSSAGELMSGKGKASSWIDSIFHMWYGHGTSASNMSSITAPVVILHSLDDNLVPFSHAESLFSAAQDTCKKVLCPLQGTHQKPKFSMRDVLYILEAVTLSSKCSAVIPCDRILHHLNNDTTPQGIPEDKKGPL